ncbi:lysogenization regulator HflD [Psychromonas sp. MB-3u-54]|jgi:high frequency lysogenization protein|uniref:high frequency lysogenization protein HflD n=1 Tax=Psychromonas sp. MB-3u-54 TaxID=2058319 RepID=UPI000C334892|nr:high frequency lysogenization protein HflD [Psychromonas sp. MB-3u-54]PKH02674.1 lysogenization regulator HflD [Psychromonas sp. MB-3u-54]
MSFNNIESRCLAFAAICQAAYLLDKIATKGLCPDAVAFDASLQSIMRVESDSPIEIFGGYDVLEVGFKSMIEQLDNGSSNRNMQVTKYIIGMISLEKKLSNNSSTLNLLSQRINQVQRQLAHFDINDSSVLSNLDSIYKDLISTLGPKIQINGSPACLQQEHTQHKIRALLLAGVRAAVLWRQLGGKRRQLIFSRKAMIHQTKQNLHRV